MEPSVCVRYAAGKQGHSVRKFIYVQSSLYVPLRHLLHKLRQIYVSVLQMTC
jgi:hypothetical protein